jgi:hypothetical protein
VLSPIHEASRQARHELQEAHADSMSKDPDRIFGEKALLAQARPGMLAFEITAR